MQDYGDGPSTGLDQTAAGKILTGFVPEDLFISGDDRAVLTSLAGEVAEIAGSERARSLYLGERFRLEELEG